MPLQQSKKTQLAILQQCEYEWDRYERWQEAQKNLQDIEPKEWTLKLQLLSMLTVVVPLRLALSLLEIPKMTVISFWIVAATIKLRLLQWRGLTCVAIAGSYGKTSTKYIATHVLQGTVRVVMTPTNINTPIGIARFILHTLDMHTQVCIFELGEYYPGDIADLVRFLRPNFRILTPVGYAHLERFGTQEILQKSLQELLTTDSRNAHMFVFGKDYGNESIAKVSVTRSGTEYEAEGETYFIPLFGAHNAINTLPALWLAKKWNMKVASVRAQLSTLPYIPHRLEPTLLENGTLLLDNGYNANPASSIESLAVVHALDGDLKVVCTPGFVELGETQEAECYKLGERIAQVATHAIIIDSINTKALLSGLQKGGMKQDHIWVEKDEITAMRRHSAEFTSRTIVLFENSVPSLYLRSTQ